MRVVISFALLISFATSQAQTVREIAKLIYGPRSVVSLDPYYYTLLPQEGKQEDFDKTFRKLTPSDIVRAQRITILKEDNVQIKRCEQCALPHVQLDTASRIRYLRNLLGYWRAVSIRTLLYRDSLSITDDPLTRSAAIVREDTTGDLVMSIDENSFRVYYKQSGQNKFKILSDSRYSLEGKRYLLLYKHLKTVSDPSFAGIDSNGRLIINSYIAEQRHVINNYTVYETTVAQTILEKLRVEQLRYKKERKEFSGTHTSR